MKLSKKERLRVLGIMSGTSCDGITLAYAEVYRSGKAVDLKAGPVETVSYRKSERERLERAADLSVGDLSGLHAWLGRRLGEAVVGFCASHDLQLDLIGSHGHTVIHRPPGTFESRHAHEEPNTLQIGDIATLARTADVDVVGDFRPGDVALGGEGAPLVPWFDHLAFRARRKRRLLVNIGGIANVTLVPWNADEVMGFDTGPGNCLLDAFCAERTDRAYDRGGSLARKGSVDEKCLRQLLGHGYFSWKPPKSTHRDAFDLSWAYGRAPGLADVSTEDGLATLAALTADSIHAAVQEFLPSPIQDVFVGGGGVLNDAVMARLRERFSPVAVDPTSAIGVDPEGREALAFATMAAARVWGLPNHLPQVTGAKRASVLGAWVHP